LSILNDIITEIRALISDVATGFNTQDKDLYPLGDVNNSDVYHSIIASLCLLEATELTKRIELLDAKNDDCGLW